MNDNDLKTDKAGLADEAKGEPPRWIDIDWGEAQAHVKSLQTKIAEAAFEGKTERVRKLQRLLTNSLHAKMVAVRRVTSNKGAKTPGIDGVIWNTPARKMQAVLSLTTKGYKAKPLRRVYIPKKNGKKRPLGIPTMHDRAMQALWALALEPVAEVTGDKHSFGFRKGRSAQDASQQLFLTLARKDRAQWVLEGDIKGCFDHISHDWLMANIPMDKKVLGQFLKAGFMEDGGWHETEEGTPQGGIISPILANMTLDGLEARLGQRFHNGRSGAWSPNVSRKHKVNLVRYADDFVVTAASPEIAEEAKSIVAEFLAERGLELSEEKTLITHVSKGFDFLGWNFRRYENGKFLTMPSKQAVNTFVREMHVIILREGISWKQEHLIHKLTPMIRGFANYHRHVCSSREFNRIDSKIMMMLFRWAKRRHPKKGAQWRKSRYWCKIGNRNWIFGNHERYLPKMAWQKIRRHPALKAGFNPYLHGRYFESRKAKLEKNYANSFRQARH